MNKTARRWVLGCILLAAIGLALMFRHRLDPVALAEWVTGAGALGPLVFMVIYALATLVFLPGSVLTLAGGALFGPVWGTLWNLTGATVGAALSFLVARHLGVDWVERRAGGRFKRLVDGVAAEGWHFVAFTRLVPLFPFNLLNYALGLTRIGFLPYLVATWIFMLPGALAFSYLGYAGREAFAGGEGLVQKALLALALVAAVVFLPRLVRKLRQRPLLEVEKLKERLEAAEDLLVLDVRAAAERLLAIARLKAQEAEEIAARHPGGATALESELKAMTGHLTNVRLGAGHQSPDYQWWHGQPALDGDLIRLRAAIHD